MDFTGTIKRTVGAGLEQEAYRQFGAAAEEFTKGTLGRIFDTTSNQRPGQPDAETGDINQQGTWSETYYAAALARGGDFRPKLKFLFKVTFQFEARALEYLGSLMGTSADEIQRNTTVMVKMVDKPKFEFDYEEVNMYNFRTKVLKRITHQELSMQFYDDSGNNVLSFLEMYRRALMPIARLRMDATRDSLQDYGFEFTEDGTGLDTSLRGVIPGDFVNPLARIIVHQMYIDSGATGESAVQNATRVNNFVFTNPRITNIDMDDVDFEQGGNPAIASLRFDFDTLYIEIGNKLLGPGTNGLEPELPTGDVMMGAVRRPGQEISTKGSRNPFIDVIARQGQRAVQETISGALNKKFVGTVAGRALGGAFNQVGSIVGEAAGRTLGSVALGVSNAISRPTVPPVKDSSTGASVTGQTGSSPNGPFPQE